MLLRMVEVLILGVGSEEFLLFFVKVDFEGV